MTELESLGRYLYGGGWQTALAAALGVNLRTVQRWAAGSDVPEGAWNDLLYLVAEKQVAGCAPILSGVERDSITLSVGDDRWDSCTDLRIKERMAEIMRGMGYNVSVL